MTGSETRYTYDPLGRLETVTQTKLLGVDLTAYGDDGWGNVRADGNVEVTRYRYDLQGAISRIVQAPGEVYEDYYRKPWATDYTYDVLHRVTSVIHSVGWEFDPEPTHRRLLARFDYTLDASGNRIAATETDDLGHVTQIDWTYDGLNRLVSESYDAPGTHTQNGIDYTDTYTFDLASNRIELTHYLHAGATPDGSDSLATGDSTTTYTYDANDRLLTETHATPSPALQGGLTDNTFTLYSWGNSIGTAGGLTTYQTGKTIHAGLTTSGDVVESTTYTYNLQARMSGTLIDHLTSSGDVAQRDTLTYAYNDANAPAGLSGIRYAMTEKTEVDDDANPATPLVVQSDTRTQFLYTPGNLNPTGYAQILEQIDRAANGNLIKALAFTIGHDVLAQAASPRLHAAEQGYLPNPINSLFFLYDAHGSTRALIDRLGQIARTADAEQVAQRFAYGAYGISLKFANHGLAEIAQSTTRLLYAGEAADANIDSYYLRARTLNVGSGRFTEKDIFAGFNQNPITLNKYIYGNSNSVNNLDYDGRFALADVIVGVAIGSIAMTSSLMIANSARHGWSPNSLSPDAAITGISITGTVNAMAALGAGAFLSYATLLLVNTPTPVMQTLAMVLLTYAAYVSKLLSQSLYFIAGVSTAVSLGVTFNIDIVSTATDLRKKIFIAVGLAANISLFGSSSGIGVFAYSGFAWGVNHIDDYVNLNISYQMGAGTGYLGMASETFDSNNHSVFSQVTGFTLGSSNGGLSAGVQFPQYKKEWSFELPGGLESNARHLLLSWPFPVGIGAYQKAMDNASF